MYVHSTGLLLLEELENIWSEKIGLFERSWKLFISEVLTLLNEDSRDETKERNIVKVLQKHRENMKEGSLKETRKNLNKKTEERAQKQLQMTRVSVEGNATMMAVEKARKV